MADITKVISDVTYTFKEVREGVQWGWKKEVDKNKYMMQLCKFNDDWFGNVTVNTHDGAQIKFEQKDVESSEILIRRLVDYVTRTIRIYAPMPMQFE